MIVVAGLSLKNLHPRVWDATSPYYLPELQGVMVSYAEFAKQPRQRERAMVLGLRAFLDVPDHVRVYLDNGAFFFLGRDGGTLHDEYAAFVAEASPDWYPIPHDHIPSPSMTIEAQRNCLVRTMTVNRAFDFDGFVPVVHISQLIDEYVEAVLSEPRLAAKPAVALGGIVPNLLRMPKARPYREVLDAIRRARAALAGREIHLFGVGGTATLHLAALLAIDSADSSGWRNRAARGIVQLPGSGDRLVADLGKWRGREPSGSEWARLAACPCPACRLGGIEGLKASRRAGFDQRAAHNLWVLLHEASEVDTRLSDGSYDSWYSSHLDNSVYLPLIRQASAWRFGLDTEQVVHRASMNQD
jgi:7-cyano-7-deazaguanine tRNA-ribosyltransferase